MFRSALTGVAALLIFAVEARAQADYPNRPVRIIVPSEAGGGTDITARVIAERLSQTMGQNFVVENRPGAGQMIGTEAAARTAPDGYTLLVTAAALTILPAVNKNVKFDILRDFAPISMLVRSPSILMIHPQLPFRSVKEFIDAAKAKPGELNYGSAGLGTQPHMAMELFRTMAGIELQHIPYRGVAPAVNAVIGGQVGAVMVNPLTAKAQMDAGRLRGLGITSARRSDIMPELPAIAETVPGYEAMQWYGIFAPAGTPAPIVQRLHKEIAAALKSPEMQKRMAAEAAEAVGNTPEEFAVQIKSELEQWAKVARAAGLAQ